MIRDLNTLDPGSLDQSTQVCVIGAGTAGIFLAQKLHERGIKVVLLEAGGRVAQSAEEFGEEPEQLGIRYRGSELGRSFGLGGTSVLWGGQLIPVTPTDMGARPAVGFESWPIGYSDIARHFDAVRESLGLPTIGLDCDHELIRRRFPRLSQLGPDFEVRLSEWLPFRTRNLAKAFDDILRRKDEVAFWLNAKVTGLRHVEGSENRRLDEVKARAPNGKTLRVRSQVVVFCAGTLETTRLLLELNEAADSLLTRSGAPLGRYFSDHLSVTCGHFNCQNWKRFNLEMAPIFRGPTMRTPRLELSSSAQQKLAVTSAFAHFTFVTHGDTGFDVVRNLLRRRQGEQLGLGLSPTMLGKVLRDVSAMAFWRGIRQRLWIPRQAELLMQVDIEQTPNWDSRLFLSSDRDAQGRKRLAIDWRIRDEDVRIIQTVAEKVVATWQNSSLADTAELRLTLPETFDNFETLYDVYHPTGTLRMASTEAAGVVNSDLRLWPFENGYVSSTAVFPSAGSANPGLTHLALTNRLAEHLARMYFR